MSKKLKGIKMEMIRVSVTLPKTIFEEMERTRKDQAMMQSEYMRHCIREALKREGR